MLRLVAILLLTVIPLTACDDSMSAVDRTGEAENVDGIGFFGSGDEAEPDERIVSAGISLPYSEIAKNCDVKKPQMGTMIAEASGYVIYDSQPNTTALRTHYITGFRDGCARQFSGALVLMGDVGTHELVRYADTGLNRDYSTTDEAYETIKASFCRVARTEPCGRRIDRLAETTSFVTIYESFSDNADWVDLLLHKGEVVAQEVNGG